MFHVLDIRLGDRQSAVEALDAAPSSLVRLSEIMLRAAVEEPEPASVPLIAHAARRWGADPDLEILLESAIAQCESATSPTAAGR